QNVLLEATEDPLLDDGLLIDARDRCLHRYPSGLIHWIAIYPAANRRKGDSRDRILSSELYARRVAGCQQLGLAARAASPDRPNRMDDVFRRQSIAPCYFGLAGLATPQ